MAIQKVGVVGCGLMGHGIVQVAAQGGCAVVVLEAETGRYHGAALAQRLDELWAASTGHSGGQKIPRESVCDDRGT